MLFFLSLIYNFKDIQFSSVQSLSRVRLFATSWIAARQASLSITNSQSSPRLTPIESVMPSSHLILGRPLLLCPQSRQASESFPMSQLFTWGGHSIGVSASVSVLLMNILDWFPLGLTEIQWPSLWTYSSLVPSSMIWSLLFLILETLSSLDLQDPLTC